MPSESKKKKDGGGKKNSSVVICASFNCDKKSSFDSSGDIAAIYLKVQCGWYL